MNPHQGHRERKKRQFRDFGLDAFADHEALELLLYYAIPRQDTNPLAHELLRRFGSLEAVLDASQEDLTTVPGIGENSALLLRLVPQLYRRALAGPRGKAVILNTPEKIGHYLLQRYAGEVREVVYELCLDQKGKLLTCCRVAEGSGASADFNVRTVLMKPSGAGRPWWCSPTTIPADWRSPPPRTRPPQTGSSGPWTPWGFSCWTTSWWRTGTMSPWPRTGRCAGHRCRRGSFVPPGTTYFCPLGKRRIRPPFSFSEKENGPRPVQKKNFFGKQG